MALSSSSSMLVFSTLPNAHLPETMRDDHATRLYQGVTLSLGRRNPEGHTRHSLHFNGQPVQLTLLKAGNDVPTTGISLNYSRLASVTISPSYIPWYVFSHTINETSGVLLLPTKPYQRPFAPPDTLEQAQANYLITFFDWSRRKNSPPPLHTLPLFNAPALSRAA